MSKAMPLLLLLIVVMLRCAATKTGDAALDKAAADLTNAVIAEDQGHSGHSSAG